MHPLIYRLLILASIVIMVFVGKSVVVGNIFVTIGLALGIFAALITLLNPENGIILLAFSMLLSPEIVLVELPKRSVTVRIDDFLLIAVFLAFLAHHAITPLSRRFIKTKIDKPLILLVLLYLLSTCLGLIQGRLKLLPSFFYVLKYVEYFILFWMTANVTASKATLKKIIIAGTLTAIIVTVFAYTLFPTAARVYPPFDTEAAGISGESGTLGGYLIIVMALALSFFANHDRTKVRYLALGLFIFMLPPFLRTLSRASYMALAAMIPALILFSPRRKMMLTLAMTGGIILVPILMPQIMSSVESRVNETFASRRVVSIGPFSTTMEDSAATRVESWQVAFTHWLPKHPFIGHGATGVGLVDTQFPRILGEFGLIGFGIFAWLIASIFINSRRNLKILKDPFEISITAGFMAALVGLLVQSLGANTFIIVRIMTPFWLLCALIMLMPLPDSPDPGQPTSPAIPSGSKGIA